MTSKWHITGLALAALALWPATTRAEPVTVDTEARAAAHAPSFCKLGSAAGPSKTSVLTLSVRHTGCATGKRLVRAYHACRVDEGDGDGSCVRRVDGYRCSERRSNETPSAFKARVSCRDGARRVKHKYTWFGDAPVVVDTEPELRAAWADPLVTGIELKADIFMRSCLTGGPIRESLRPLTLDGNGHTIRQTCFEKRLLNQNGTGFLEIRDVTLTRGGNDGPGAAITSRGEIVVMDSRVHENLSEEPGGGIFSQRKATIIRSVITGNLANDDGGGVYARRGGIQVFDSILSDNLVDGSGGALGSTGDILVVRSHVDGNTTDGDGGAIYTDEDGDVTVIDSTVDGNTPTAQGRDLHPRGRRDDRQLDRERQPRRRPGRGDLGRGRCDRDQLDDRPQRRGRPCRRRDLGPQRSLRDQLDDQQQLRRGPGRRRASRRGRGPHLLHDHRQHRAGRCEHRGRRGPHGHRLDHRPGQHRAHRWSGPAHRDQLSGVDCRVARLQRRLRRFLRPRRPGRCRRWGRPVARRPRRRTAGSARPGCPSPAARSWTGSRQEPAVRPVRLRPRGRAAPRGFQIDPIAPVTTDQRGASRDQGAGAMSARSSSARCRLLGRDRPPTWGHRRPTSRRNPIRAIRATSPVAGPSPPAEASETSDRAGRAPGERSDRS